MQMIQLKRANMMRSSALNLYMNVYKDNIDVNIDYSWSLEVSWNTIDSLASILNYPEFTH